MLQITTNNINLYVEFVDAPLEEVVGTRQKGCARRRHVRGVSPLCAPVLSFTHYLQAPAMQASP